MRQQRHQSDEREGMRRGPLATEPGTLEDAKRENPVEEAREEIAEARQQHRAGEAGEARAERDEEMRERGQQAASAGPPVGEAQGHPAAAPAEPAHHLLSDQERTRFLQRWERVQGRFVDNPRESVAEADTLVSDVIEELRELFDSERSGLEGTWSRGEEVSTETLRRSLQRYRAFFARLLEL
ncbi:MAG TPA: hypothetical protein VMT16_17045 [Thermoanaerobaculia bacterium]|nr:hypothetical protein [Thermoanaerobaculia bacterium]